MRNRKHSNSSFTVFVKDSDQTRLKQFSLHELAFYNQIVECMESRTRAFPRQVSELTNSQIQILCDLAKLGVKWEQVLTHECWHTAHMQNMRKDFCAQDKCVWPDWLQYVAKQILNFKVVLIPDTKSIMLRTMLEFYRDQAIIFREPLHAQREDHAYKVAAQNISKQDTQTKRHVQIPRNSVRVKYENPTDESLIYTPLTTEPIRIPGINLNEREGWHMLILRQEPGRYVTPDTPWLAEFRHTHNQYLIRLVDIGSNRRPS